MIFTVLLEGNDIPSVHTQVLNICSGIPRGWFGGFNPPSAKFRSFDEAEPNSQFHGKYIRKNLIRIWVSLI
jgi:hypothetical protein